MPPKRSPSLFFPIATGGSSRTTFRGYGKQAQASGLIGHQNFKGQLASSVTNGVHSAVAYTAHSVPSFQDFLLRSNFGSREEEASVALASFIAAPAPAFSVKSSLLRAPVEVLDSIYSSGLVLAGIRKSRSFTPLPDSLHLATVDLGAEVHLLSLPALLHERFVIYADEGQPIDWLLGMAITQDIDAGTVHLDMETAITKLAEGILTPEEVLFERQ